MLLSALKVKCRQLTWPRTSKFPVFSAEMRWYILIELAKVKDTIIFCTLSAEGPGQPRRSASSFSAESAGMYWRRRAGGPGGRFLQLCTSVLSALKSPASGEWRTCTAMNQGAYMNEWRTNRQAAVFFLFKKRLILKNLVLLSVGGLQFGCLPRRL